MKLVNRKLSLVIVLLFAGTLICRAKVTEKIVQCGADRLFKEYAHLIDGKRIGLVSNHSGRLSDGTHLADALFKHPGTKLQVLFGMEFNIRTNDYSLQHDEEKSVDVQTGLPKYSLYGSIHKPTKEMLGNIEVLIFDIQEIGIRFYEHVNVLGFVMEACAENNISLIVLDRPNPLNGMGIEGFVADNEFLYSFGSFGKIPVRHGMTMGELANMYNGEGMLRGGTKAKLQVIEMKDWQRKMWFDQTGLAWRKPSPNLLSLSSVLAYTGTCIFEGLNISEGRGTEKPFENIGSPWLKNKEAIQLLKQFNFEGVKFDAVEFVPEKKAYLGRAPEMSGELCKGIYVHVTDRSKFKPYRTGVALLWAIHKLHADQLVWNDKTLLRLTGTNRLLEMIRNGKNPDEITQSWQAELSEFASRRTKYLLY